MPTYVAFLRAINLGTVRRFPKEAIVAAVTSVGGTAVQTYLASGNVRLTSTLRSGAKVEAALEAAFLADRGFEVPTVVLSPAEVMAVAADVAELWARYGEPAAHSVTLLKRPPPPAAADVVEALRPDGDRAVVRGRAVHVLLTRSVHESALLASRELATLGVGTARNARVVRELARRWG